MLCMLNLISKCSISITITIKFVLSIGKLLLYSLVTTSFSNKTNNEELQKRPVRHMFGVQPSLPLPTAVTVTRL